jgi:hypothetical protein
VIVPIAALAAEVRKKLGGFAAPQFDRAPVVI